MIAAGSEIFTVESHLAARFETIRRFAKTIRASEYHLTNACNIRCQGCWFFERKFDSATTEVKDLQVLREFIVSERQRGINSAVLIGGEPLLTPDRIAAYVEGMQYVTLSTNGLRPLASDGFENVQVFVTLFGGGTFDDRLRAIRPDGRRFSGLFETALSNFYADPRAVFVLQMVEEAVEMVEPTVQRILDNGNRVTFGLYSAYNETGAVQFARSERLLEEALRVRDLFPTTVLNTPYAIHALVKGESHFGRFGYHSCPSISTDHPAHSGRRENGNRTLPLFNTYAPDLKTINFCCTSGRCDTCRDSQAVWSWLLVHADKFVDDQDLLKEWIELAEAYWGQFVWSPVRPARN